MPDWVHAVLLIVIWTAAIFLFTYYMENQLLGVVLGFLVGRLAAVFIVKLLPGFWGEDS